MAFRVSGYWPIEKCQQRYRSRSIKQAHEAIDGAVMHDCGKVRKKVDQEQLVAARIELLQAHMKLMKNPDDIARAERTIAQLQGAE